MMSREELIESIERINSRVRKIADANGMVSGLEVCSIIDEEFGTNYALRGQDWLGWLFNNTGEREPYEWDDVFNVKNNKNSIVLDFKLPNIDKEGS